MMYIDGDGLCLLIVLFIVVFMIGVTVGVCYNHDDIDNGRTA